MGHRVMTVSPAYKSYDGVESTEVRKGFNMYGFETEVHAHAHTHTHTHTHAQTPAHTHTRAHIHTHTHTCTHAHTHKNMRSEVLKCGST